MRIAAPIVALVLAVLAGVVARAAPSRPPQDVPCDEIIHHTKFPYRSSGYRLVLGVVSVPPAYLRQVVPTNSQPWAYWRKAGLVVRAGGPLVSVSVPKAWRNRVAITWGNTTGIVSSLRIPGCPSPLVPTQPHGGNAYAGGFYLRSRSACVPLIFGVGKRRATVRFGLGRPCK
jgi:hypothetical protein